MRRLLEHVPFVRGACARAWAQGYATAEYDLAFASWDHATNTPVVYHSPNPYLRRWED